MASRSRQRLRRSCAKSSFYLLLYSFVIAMITVLWMQDTVTGFLLAGVGNVDLRKKTNFLVVNESELLLLDHVA